MMWVILIVTGVVLSFLLSVGDMTARKKQAQDEGY